MAVDPPAIPAEQEALDHPWRLWASVAIGSFVLVTVLLGFIVLPLAGAGGEGFDPFSAICRAIGIPGYGPAVPASVGTQVEAKASAVVWSATTRQQLAGADAKAGAAIATEVCAACHGETGVSTDPTQFPNLAGQSEAAIFKQLWDFHDGSRVAEAMTPFAQQLEPKQILDVAAHYAAAPAAERQRAATAVSQAVVQLATIGSPARGIASCDSCHGDNRSGPDGAPVLLGQSQTYLEAQIQAFAKGERANDLFLRMRTIAGQLTPEEMSGLATYYSGNPIPRYRP
jgi:cytochrome c553